MRVIDFFDRGALLHPDRAFMIAEDGAITTYRDVQTLSHRTALAMVAAGFGYRKNAAIYSPNAPGAFDALLGIYRAGGAWVPINARNAIAENAYEQETGKLFAVPLYEDPFAARPLRARFGQLHTYRVVTSGDPASEALFLDLGFSVAAEVPVGMGSSLSADQIVHVEPGPDGPILTPCAASTRRYTYRAWVQRVIDGDTLIAIVDLGLGHQTRPIRLRLRGIDCPELSTLAGRTARDFVREALAPAPFIVITTHRTDAYGR